MNKLDYYTYKKQNFVCPKCKWQGSGNELNIGETFSGLFELDCPSCHRVVGMVPFPTFDDVLAQGGEEEKARIRKAKEHNKKIDATQLRSTDSLPSVSGSIVIDTKEVVADNERWLEIYANQELLWKEIIYYEYYERFIELCLLLSKKYKGRIETINLEYTLDLLGDSISAHKKIDSCVKRIRALYKKKRYK